MTKTSDSVTIEQARVILAPFYDALNEPAKKDVKALFDKVVHPDYKSYFTNDEFLPRGPLIEIFKNMGVTIPDLKWSIRELMIVGDKIIVRGQATGTPTGEFWGAKPTGRSFDTMAIDIFTVRDGKLISCHHIENWMTALQQIGK